MQNRLLTVWYAALLVCSLTGGALAQSSHPTVWTPAKRTSLPSAAAPLHPASAAAAPPAAQAATAAAAAKDLRFDLGKLPPSRVDDNSHPGGPYFQTEANLEVLRRNQHTAEEMLRPYIPTQKSYGETDNDFSKRQKTARDRVELIMAPFNTEVNRLEIMLETLAPTATGSKILRQTLKQEHFVKSEERYQKALKRLEEAERVAPQVPKQRGYGETESAFQARLKETSAQREALLGKLRKEKDDAEQQMNEANKL